MKKLFQFTLGVCLLASTAVPASAGFSSLYVFGDGLSTTTDPQSGPPFFYTGRDSNGRVWVEVLAQRQGLQLNNANNDSYWDHNSGDLVTELNNYALPANIANDLFIVWVCNADTYDATVAALYNPSTDYNTLLNSFIAANIQSQANHLQIITTLYAMGVRNLILPNAVDISTIPAFNAGTLAGVEHAGCVDYNARFANTINQARALCPGLTIYTPDYFTLLNNVLSNAASFGLTNALSARGFSIDAYSSIPNLTLNGQGTNYIFWDPEDPTAKFHEIIADVAQQLVSPVQINWLALFNGSNRLDVVNMPLGLNGFVLGSTNLAPGSWTSVTNISSTSAYQSIFVNASPLPPSIPASGTGGSGSIDPNNTNNVGTTYIPPFNPAQYYRLQFPYAWSWP